MSKALAVIVRITKTEQEIKRLLLALIASLALPTAVNAERNWLLVEIDISWGVEIKKIEMESMAQCNEQASIWLNSDNIKHEKKYRSYECLTGK